MAVTITPVPLSGLTDQKPLKVSVTSAAAALKVHDIVASGAVPEDFDEIYLWVVNTTAAVAQINLHIDDGAVGDPDDFLVRSFSVPANSPPIPILTGVRLNGGHDLEVWSDTANALNVYGFANRLTVT